MKTPSISFHPWIEFGLKFKYQVKAWPDNELPNSLNFNRGWASIATQWAKKRFMCSKANEYKSSPLNKLKLGTLKTLGNSKSSI